MITKITNSLKPVSLYCATAAKKAANSAMKGIYTKFSELQDASKARIEGIGGYMSSLNCLSSSKKEKEEEPDISDLLLCCEPPNEDYFREFREFQHLTNDQKIEEKTR